MQTSFLSRLFDIVAPRQCALCGLRLAATERAICAVCHLHLPLTGYERRATDNPMARLFWGLMPTERAAAWFFYEPQSEAGHLIYELKYHNRPLLARDLGAMAARQMAACGFFDGIDGLLPVPLSRRRQWQRGYNQSHEICKGIAETTALPIYINMVKRTRFTASQTKLGMQQRQTNVANAFAPCGDGPAPGAHLLIVDDVVTTGATVCACASALSAIDGLRFSVFSLGFTHT